MTFIMKRVIIISITCFFLLNCNKNTDEVYTVKKIKVEDFKTIKDSVTKPTIVHFWFSMCHGCVKGLPELNEFCNKNKIQLIHISSDKNGSKMEDMLRDFTKKYKLKNSFIVDYKNLYGTNNPKFINLVGDYCNKIGLHYKDNPVSPYFALLDGKGNIEKEFYLKDSLFLYIKNKK